MRIAIIGQQCAGKTTVANIIKETLEDNGKYVKTIKFTDPIYKSLKALGQEKHRAFMQEYGDLAKKHFGEMVFVDNFINAVGYFKYVDAIICDDVRRVYELEACLSNGFKIIYIEASQEIKKQRAAAQGFAFIENHNSETEIPSMKLQADYVITNNVSCMSELKDVVGSFGLF